MLSKSLRHCATRGVSSVIPGEFMTASSPFTPMWTSFHGTPGQGCAVSGQGVPADKLVQCIGAIRRRGPGHFLFGARDDRHFVVGQAGCARSYVLVPKAAYSLCHIPQT